MQEMYPANDVIDSLDSLRAALAARPDPDQVVKFLCGYAGRWDGIVTRPPRPAEELEKTTFLPIYNARSIDIVSDLANQPFFARLKEIHQLGSTRLFKNVDAGHTRWGHSIGVVSALGEALDSIQRHGVDVPDEWVKAALFAGLTHDAMQGPWSHSLEFMADIFPREHDSDTGRWDKVMARAELANENSVLCKLLCGALSRLQTESGDLTGLVRRIGILLDRETCADVYPEWVFLAQLIDSDLDADRIDYLIRDNRYLGRQREDEYIAAARSVIGGLAVARASWGGKDVRVLAFDEHSKEDIQTLLNLRQELYSNVYEHPENVAVDEMIAHALFYVLRPRGFFEVDTQARNVQSRVNSGLQADVARQVGFLTDSQFSEVLTQLALSWNCPECNWAVQLSRDAEVNPFEPLAVQWIDSHERDMINDKVDEVLAKENLLLAAARERLGLMGNRAIPGSRNLWRGAIEASNLEFKDKLGLLAYTVGTYGQKIAVEAEFWAKLWSDEKFKDQLENFFEASFGPQSYFEVDDFENIPLVHISVPWHPKLRKAAPYATEIQSELPCAFYRTEKDGRTTYDFEPVSFSPADTWLPFLSCPEWLKRYQGAFLVEQWRHFIENDYDRWIVED